MNRITHSPHAAPRPSPAELAEFARKLRDLGPESGLYPPIVSIDAGHLFHSLGTGADLALPSYVATADDLFLPSPNLSPAFFYSWDVHPEQQPDWFQVSARFTPSDFGIGDTLSYEVEWVVLPFFLDLGAVLTLEASPNPGPGAGSSTLGEARVFTLSMAVGPIEPNETLYANLIRNSRVGSWIWLRTNITYLPPTRALAWIHRSICCASSCWRFVFLTVVGARRLCRLLFLRLVRVQEGAELDGRWP